jgi:hypothetical protein
MGGYYKRLAVALFCFLLSSGLAFGQTCPPGTSPTNWGTTRDQTTDQIRQVACVDPSGKIHVNFADVNRIKYAVDFEGADGGAQIHACLVAAAAAAKICDASGFLVGQTSSSNPFNGVSGVVTLIYPSISITTSHGWVLGPGQVIIAQGGRNARSILTCSAAVTTACLKLTGTGIFGEGWAYVEGLKIVANSAMDDILIQDSGRNRLHDVWTSGAQNGLHLNSITAAGASLNQIWDSHLGGSVHALLADSTSPGYVTANTYNNVSYDTTTPTGTAVQITGTVGTSAGEDSFLNPTINGSQNGVGGKAFDFAYAMNELILNGSIEANTIGVQIEATSGRIKVLGGVNGNTTDFVDLSPSNATNILLGQNNWFRNLVFSNVFAGGYPAATDGLTFFDSGVGSFNLFMQTGYLQFIASMTGTPTWTFNGLDKSTALPGNLIVQGNASKIGIPGPFASLFTCNGAAEGYISPVTDSNTNVWGASVASGGANHVLAYCDGTNWTVFAK